MKKKSITVHITIKLIAWNYQMNRTKNQEANKDMVVNA